MFIIWLKKLFLKWKKKSWLKVFSKYTVIDIQHNAFRTLLENHGGKNFSSIFLELTFQEGFFSDSVSNKTVVTYNTYSIINISEKYEKLGIPQIFFRYTMLDDSIPKISTYRKSGSMSIMPEFVK